MGSADTALLKCNKEFDLNLHLKIQIILYIQVTVDRDKFRKNNQTQTHHKKATYDAHTQPHDIRHVP
jgi:hypothetical protein